MRSPPPATARPGSRAKASKRRPFSRPRRLPQGEHACGRPTARVARTSISCSPTVTPGPRVRAEQVTASVAYHGEGPVWSERWGGLRWVDMLAGDVLSLGEDGAIGRRHVGEIAAAVRPRRGGGAVIGVERGFALEDPDGTLIRLDELWSGDGVRMNEGGCDPDGRFYCGSMAYDQAPRAASLYRLDADGTVHVVLDGVTVSNG